jgi:hypothetical protein
MAAARRYPAALTELRDWLDELERFWQARLAALGDYLERAHRPSAAAPAAVPGR